MSSLKNINFVPDSAITIKGNYRTFRISYESLGLPSCAKIWYNVDLNISKPISFGSSQSDCNSLYPNALFRSIYNTSNGILSFDMLMTLNGLANIKFQINNFVETITVTTQATVSSLICQRPELGIENRASDFLNPTVIAKSKMFSLIGTTTLNCDSDLQNTKQWYLYEIDPVIGNVIKTISLANNPSSNNAELFMESSSLIYGTYKFVYQVSMYGGASSFVEQIDTYVKIEPTGIAIFPFSGGMKQKTIGVGQSVELDPGRYSYDFDGLLNGTQLTYRFFCRIVIDGLAQEFPSSSYNSFVDLKQIQDGTVSVNMSTLTTCFNTSSIQKIML